MKKLLAVLLLSTLCFSQVCLAEPVEKGKVWVNLGTILFENRAQLNFTPKQDRLATVHVDYFENDVFKGSFGDSSITDVGATYGLIKKKENVGYVSASSGLSYVKYTSRVWNLPYTSESSIGITPIEAQAFLTPTKNFGIGVIGKMEYIPMTMDRGSIGDSHIYPSAFLAIQFGKLP